MRNTWFIIVVLIVVSFCRSTAQIIQGIPFIKNYPSTQYKSHPKNFAVLENHNGIIYVANAYGVLEYDGISWRLIDLPNGKSAISLARAGDDKVMVGSVGEFGYLNTDSIGNTIYTSLSCRLPKKDLNFQEIFKTFEVPEGIVFSAHHQITLLRKDQSAKVLYPSSANSVFDFATVISDQILFRESGRGLVQFKGEVLEPVTQGEYFRDKVIYAIHAHSSGKLLIVSHEGLSLYDGNSIKPLVGSATTFIKENAITDVIQLKNNYYAISTGASGLIIIDDQGNLVRHLTKKDGLLGDYVFDLYVDSKNNIWVSTDNGIGYILINNPFAIINESSDVLGMGYAAYVYRNKLYLGTSKGLFFRDLNSGHSLQSTTTFTPVKNAEGQVWYLNEVGGTLLCGHLRGLFQVHDDVASRISPNEEVGGWVFKGIKDKPYLILGTYTGLQVYEKKNGNWNFRNTVKGFEESSRTLEIDDQGDVWVCHGNNGLYKITLNATMDGVKEVINMNSMSKLPPDYFNDIARIEDSLVFAGDNRLFRYNRSRNVLEKHYLNYAMDKHVLIARIVQQNNGDIWMANRDEIEVLVKQKEGRYRKERNFFRKLKGQLIGSYEFFWRYNEGNYFIGTQNGFVHYNQSVSDYNTAFTTAIRKVELIKARDSLIYAGGSISRNISHLTDVNNSGVMEEISYFHNAIRFSCAALFYEDQEKNQYQYALELAGDSAYQWSSWTIVPFKEYTNIHEGRYKFHVRAKNVYGYTSNIATYTFSILPPWYRTTVAYTIYFFLLIFAFVLVARFTMQKIRREKQRIEREKEKELLLLQKQFTEEALEAEKKLILLQKEKLEAEVKYKNDELAHLATNLTQKNEFLSHLKKDLVAISKDSKEKGQLLTSLIKDIDRGSDLDDSWDHFQANFDVLHHNFLSKVRERFPTLKYTDLLLCAYIKMNKSNKEISTLLNVSVSAVEKRRFRLREKLKLDNDTKLTEYLLEI